MKIPDPISQRDARIAAARFLRGQDDVTRVVRFPVNVRIEHIVLTVTFTLLAATGLSQTYWESAVGRLLLSVFGGIEETRLVHRTAAVLMTVHFIYHAAYWIDQWFVYKKNGMMLAARDAADFLQMWKYNFGVSPARPRFGRFNFDQKLQYWFVVFGVLVLGVSGMFQLFPEQTINLIPVGWLVPLAREVHRSQAVLTVLVFLIWHGYHTFAQRWNTSIFSGTITLQQMEQNHPLELEYLQQAAALAESAMQSVNIEMPIAEEIPSETSDPDRSGDMEIRSKGNEI